MCDTCRGVTRRSMLKHGLALGAGLLVGGWRQASRVAAAPAIIDCATWGAQPPREPITVLAARPTKIIIHHTAGANTTDGSLSHAYQLARAIQQAHFDRGWIDSGQHFTISRGGYVLEGRHRSLEALTSGAGHVRGAHCDGQNDVAVGIENEGTYTSVAPPQVLYEQLVELCTYVCRQYGISSTAIYGHRDFNATACPGDRLYALLPQLRSDVAARLGEAARVWPLVRRGDSGERVRTVQYLLRARGASLSVDGLFGSATEQAVRQFQSARGLSVDGIVGTQTWEALIITTRRGDSGDQVRAVQSQLAARGYGTSVDGLFGAITESHVQQFQAARGLTSDGIVGPQTWCALVA